MRTYFRRGGFIKGDCWAKAIGVFEKRERKGQKVVYVPA